MNDRPSKHELYILASAMICDPQFLPLNTAALRSVAEKLDERGMLRVYDDDVYGQVAYLDEYGRGIQALINAGVDDASAYVAYYNDGKDYPCGEGLAWTSD